MTEEDPTAIEPDPDTLPDKPVVEGLPTDEEIEAEEEAGEEDVEFMPAEEAAADDSIDDAEHDD